MLDGLTSCGCNPLPDTIVSTTGQKTPPAEFVIAGMAICGVAGSIMWIANAISARLPLAAADCLNMGVLWVNLAAALAQSLFDKRPTEDDAIAATVDSSGNRALQTAWNTGPRTNRANAATRLWSARGVTAALWFALLIGAYWMLSDLGDHALGFLVGAGVSVVAIATWGAAGYAAYTAWRLAIRSLRPTTPAPAP
jgi:hypothetical protein